MIIFTCRRNYKDNKTTKFNFHRKEAVKMIKNGFFDEYDNVVVEIGKEKFNLRSERSKEYFGLRG